jgi:hypothetical protein
LFSALTLLKTSGGPKLQSKGCVEFAEMKSTARLSAVIGLVPAETEEAQKQTNEAAVQMLGYDEIRSETERPSDMPTKMNAAQLATAAHRRKQ